MNEEVDAIDEGEQNALLVEEDKRRGPPDYGVLNESHHQSNEDGQS